MFFVEKIGVYSHGVWWIGDSFEVARNECLKLASMDTDNYHKWLVKRFKTQCIDLACVDPKHDIVFRVNKDAAIEYMKTKSLIGEDFQGGDAVMNVGDAV